MSSAQVPSARMAAKSMISMAEETGLRLTNLKIQKLLYFAHGLMLARHNESLVQETFQAWKYGPVLENLYHALKIFGPSEILHESIFIKHWEEIPKENTKAYKAIKDVLDQLGGLSGGRLIEISHHEAGPWHSVYHASETNIQIENSLIKEYFEGIVNSKVSSN